MTEAKQLWNSNHIKSMQVSITRIMRKIYRIIRLQGRNTFVFLQRNFLNYYKMNLYRIVFTVAALLYSSAVFCQSSIDVKKEISDAALQYKVMLSTHPDIASFPQSVFPDGQPRNMPSEWWCSGFFGGSLWYLYEYTHDPALKAAAEKWTMAVQKEQYNKSTHDLGFMLYCSFGNGYRLTKNPLYRKILLTGAASLATRYNADYGVIKSWDVWKEYNYPVIIDNMMNLEFLLWAAKASGRAKYYDICISHADHTIKNHYKKDYSSFHVVCYSKGGSVIKQGTHQGYSDSSAWARGQAWGLYGYTVMYRVTKQQRYLKQAQRIARFILNHPKLPVDKIPYWDFDAPGIPNQEKDASAGAIMASALLELSQYSGAKGDEYYKAAEKMLQSLSSPTYKAEYATNNGFLLKHSVGSKPHHSEVDSPLIYADYYYLEALLRYEQLTKMQHLKF